MQKLRMREVHEVVDRQLVVGRRGEIAPYCVPAALVGKLREIGNEPRIRSPGLPHPDPHNPLLFVKRVGSDMGTRRDMPRVIGVEYTSAGPIETQSVIATLNGLPLEAASAQWCESMWAAIEKCGGRPGLRTEEYDGIIQQGSGQQLVLHELIGPRTHIPGVAQKHRHSPGKGLRQGSKV